MSKPEEEPSAYDIWNEDQQRFASENPEEMAGIEIGLLIFAFLGLIFHIAPRLQSLGF